MKKWHKATKTSNEKSNDKETYRTGWYGVKSQAKKSSRRTGIEDKVNAEVLMYRKKGRQLKVTNGVVLATE